MQKARRHPSKGLRPLVGARFQVLLHSAVRGSFHLSLTVLVRYRSLSSIQPWRMVPPDSDRVSPAPPYSGFGYGRTRLRVRGFHALRPGFPKWFPWHVLPDLAVLQPRSRLDAPGLGFSAFARRYSRNHCCFLLLRVLRCFSSPGSPTLTSVPGLQPGGLPHSDMLGSIPVCRSPSLFAAYHVFHRLRIA